MKTLCDRMGLKAQVKVDRETGETRGYTNSTISAAFVRLEDAQLVWTKKGSRGRASVRELLVGLSSASAEDKGGAAGGLSSVVQEDSSQVGGALSSCSAEVQSSYSAEGKYQWNTPCDGEQPNNQQPENVLRYAGGQTPPGDRRT
jgi:hypothetical protein